MTALGIVGCGLAKKLKMATANSGLAQLWALIGLHGRCCVAKFRMGFVFATTVERAEGWQLWLIEAESKEAALAKFKNGEGDCIAESVEVTDIGQPTLASVHEHIEPA